MFSNSCLAVTLNRRITMILLYISFLSFLTSVQVSRGTFTDIACLKSIKDSFEDPGKHLNASWNFNNITEGFICSFTGVDCWHSDENKVLNIRLTNMGLRGNFPRGIENCTTITGLNLSGNQISGTIPPDISQRLHFLSVLDLSHNNLSGEIPTDIANCSYLNVLKLGSNQLTGQIPAGIGLLPRIKIFSVENNFLSGPVPVFYNVSVEAKYYADNLGLCGGPLDPCLATAKKTKVFFISGFIVGYVVAVTSVLLIFLWFFMPKPPEKKNVTKKNGENQRRRRSIHYEDIKISTLQRLVTRISFKEISVATSDFNEDNVIGFGNMGTMHKAVLTNGWFLAVKRFNNTENFKRQFVSEIMTLGRLRHRNLVPLLGFCTEGKEKLLVYKYMSNGTLYNWLHYQDVDAKIIDWPLRVRIIVGIARGLAWLHCYCNIRVVHLNISSKCILLDHKFEPKISNFGQAIYTNPKTQSITQSIKDFVCCNEFWELSFFKKDVYSFGLMLFELITGKDPSEASEKWTATYLPICSSEFLDGIDKCLVGQGYDGDIFEVLRVAYKCVQPRPEQRPTMHEVYEELKVLEERYGLTDDSMLLSQSEVSNF